MQGVLLRFFCEQELPLVVWTDNGGPFRHVIQAALEKTCGVKPRHIPPGRPQANGLVEVYNRIMDAAHAGERSRLMTAVLAYNLPQSRFGTSPETLWRALRPLHSRWRNLQLQSRGLSVEVLQIGGELPAQPGFRRGIPLGGSVEPRAGII